MLFLIVLVLMVWYLAQAGSSPVDELRFMLGVFVGLAYVAGFIDSRIFARFDRQKGNMLAEAEARYEANTEASANSPVTPSGPLP